MAKLLHKPSQNPPKPDGHPRGCVAYNAHLYNHLPKQGKIPKEEDAVVIFVVFLILDGGGDVEVKVGQTLVACCSHSSMLLCLGLLCSRLSDSVVAIAIVWYRNE